MKRFDICTSRTYKDKNGEEKKAWRTVGQLIEWPAKDDKPRSFSIELHMHPETRFSVFEEKDREEKRDDGAGDDF